MSNEEPAMNGITEGSLVTIMIQPNAMPQVGTEEMGEDSGFSMSSFSFCSSADLLVGPDVQIRPGTVTSNCSQTTVTSDLVRLWPSQVTVTVGNIDHSIGNLTSPLFKGATPPIASINVVTLSNTEMEDGSGSNLPAMGSIVSVKGLLFNTSPTPMLMTRTMREQFGD